MTKTLDLNRFKSAVGFVPQFTCEFGNVRKANIEKVTLDTNGQKPATDDPVTITTTDDQKAERKAKKVMSLRKQLIISKEYEAIKRFYGELRTWIYSQSVPSFFRAGFQLASLESVAIIEKRMRQASGLDPVADDVETLPKLIAAFVAAYPAQVEEAQKTLEPVGQWNARDYPTAAELPGMFSISWNWIAFTTPEGLPAELRAAEQAKMEKQMTDAADQVTQALRVGFAELIAHATDKLTGTDANGKPKVFRDSLIGNISDFLETFSRRNITNDVDLQQLINKAKEVLNPNGSAITPQKLRDMALVRENTAKQFAEIKTQLDSMITVKPSRAISLED